MSTVLHHCVARLSARLFPIYLLNRLTFALEFFCVCVMTVAHMGLKVKVIGQDRCLGRMGVVTQ